MTAILDTNSADQKNTVRMPGKFVRRAACVPGQESPAVLLQSLTVLEAESEGYNPYDHAPPLPAGACDGRA